MYFYPNDLGSPFRLRRRFGPRPALVGPNEGEGRKGRPLLSSPERRIPLIGSTNSSILTHDYCGTPFIFEVRADAKTGEHPWAEYFRTDMQPTTTMMLVAFLMILYSRVAGC